MQVPNPSRSVSGLRSYSVCNVEFPCPMFRAKTAVKSWDSIGELPDTPWIHATFYVALILDRGVFGNLYCYTVFFENYGTPYGVAAYS